MGGSSKGSRASPGDHHLVSSTRNAMSNFPRILVSKFGSFLLYFRRRDLSQDDQVIVMSNENALATQGEINNAFIAM